MPVSLSTDTFVGKKTLSQIRADFPMLSEVINGHPLVWLDNGAATLRSQAVIERISYYVGVRKAVHEENEICQRSTGIGCSRYSCTCEKDTIIGIRHGTGSVHKAFPVF